MSENPGGQVRRRRKQFGVSQRVAAETAGVGLSTWQKAEHGQPIHELSETRLCRFLGWQDGSYTALLAGSEPSVIDELDGADAVRIAELEQAVVDITESLRETRELLRQLLNLADD